MQAQAHRRWGIELVIWQLIAAVVSAAVVGAAIALIAVWALDESGSTAATAPLKAYNVEQAGEGMVDGPEAVAAARPQAHYVPGAGEGIVGASQTGRAGNATFSLESQRLFDLNMLPGDATAATGPTLDRADWVARQRTATTALTYEQIRFLELNLLPESSDESMAPTIPRDRGPLAH